VRSIEEDLKGLLADVTMKATPATAMDVKERGRMRRREMQIPVQLVTDADTDTKTGRQGG
jgi:hypothetical protein